MKNPSREEEKNFFKPTNQKETSCPPPLGNRRRAGKSLTPPRLPASPAAQYELANPPKLPFPLPLLYSIKKIHHLHSGLLRQCCVKRVPARACNKVPHCFCIDPRPLWCLVRFHDPGTTNDIVQSEDKKHGLKTKNKFKQ